MVLHNKSLLVKLKETTAILMTKGKRDKVFSSNNSFSGK